MSLYKTKGIVIKSYKLGEADKIVVILTNTHGKVRAVAKGIRKTKSKFGSRLEPFTHVDLLIYKGRNLDIITQAEIINPFSSIKDDFDRLYYASAMLDLADRVSSEGEHDAPLYNLSLKSLEILSSIDKNMRLLLMAFDAKLMAISGYMPKLKRCVLCESAENSKMNFSYDLGGIICSQCSVNDKKSLNISKAAIELLRSLIQLRLIDIVNLKIEPLLEDEVYFLLRDYVAYYIQERLKSRELLRLTYV